MRKMTWNTSHMAAAQLRGLTRRELAQTEPLVSNIADGWRLQLHGLDVAPGPDPRGYAVGVQYTPLSLGGLFGTGWTESWIALRRRDDRVCVLHAIHTDDGGSVNELAEWYELPLSVYREPRRLKVYGYEAIRAATLVDVMERSLWFHHQYERVAADPPPILERHMVLRSENGDAIERLEAVLRLAHPMLRRRAPLFDEYCGVIELAATPDTLGRCAGTDVTLRLAPRGEWDGEPYIVLLDVTRPLDRRAAKGASASAIFGAFVETLTCSETADVELLEGSRLANDAQDPEAAVADFVASPVLQRLQHRGCAASLFATLSWGRLVLPPPGAPAPLEPGGATL